MWRAIGLWSTGRFKKSGTTLPSDRRIAAIHTSHSPAHYNEHESTEACMARPFFRRGPLAPWIAVCRSPGWLASAVCLYVISVHTSWPTHLSPTRTIRAFTNARTRLNTLARIHKNRHDTIERTPRYFSSRHCRVTRVPLCACVVAVRSSVTERRQQMAMCTFTRRSYSRGLCR